MLAESVFRAPPREPFGTELDSPGPRVPGSARVSGTPRRMGSLRLGQLVEPFQLSCGNIPVERYYLNSEQVAHLLACPVQVP